MSLCSLLPQEAGFAARGSSRHHQGPGLPAHAHRQGEPKATAHPGSWWPAAHHSPSGTETRLPRLCASVRYLQGPQLPADGGAEPGGQSCCSMSRRSEEGGQAYEEVLCHHPHFKDREVCSKVTEACQGRDHKGPGSVAWAHSQVSALPPTAPPARHDPLRPPSMMQRAPEGSEPQKQRECTMRETLRHSHPCFGTSQSH